MFVNAESEEDIRNMVHLRLKQFFFFGYGSVSSHACYYCYYYYYYFYSIHETG